MSTPETSTPSVLVADPPGPMDSVLDTIERLRAVGFTADLSASLDGRLACGACDELHDPATITVERIHRFEGASDPDDELILFAVRATCGHRGIYTSAFGADAPRHDVLVIGQLRAPSSP